MPNFCFCQLICTETWSCDQTEAKVTWKGSHFFDKGQIHPVLTFLPQTWIWLSFHQSPCDQKNCIESALISLSHSTNCLSSDFFYVNSNNKLLMWSAFLFLTSERIPNRYKCHLVISPNRIPMVDDALSYASMWTVTPEWENDRKSLFSSFTQSWCLNHYPMKIYLLKQKLEMKFHLTLI